ncbi:MAG: DUF4139 domain-containing protein [Acidobacteria bacterium]|nr:DUF4139 domain-containing protein [Acidobacteriota bacterium]
MHRFIAAVLVLSVMAGAQAGAPANDDVRLPIRKVVLYKNGVGYFEHQGAVRGTRDITIDFTTAQLNDVLKSLTVLDLGHGHVSGISYNSTAPLEQRLRALRLPIGQQPSREGFLNAIRGARVEVKSGAAAVSGRLLGVESRERKLKDDETGNVTIVSVITDEGEMRSFELGPATSLHLLDRSLRDDVSRYLELLGTSRKDDERQMTIAAAGTGERQLLVSYISEVPVWKSTYRLVLPERAGEKTLLQGWAVVDNTIGEDWENVQLSLVAGAPQSFVQQISQPYYTRRPAVPLPSSAMLEPQTHEATMTNIDEKLLPADSAAPPPTVPAAGALQTMNADVTTFATVQPGVARSPGAAKYYKWQERTNDMDGTLKKFEDSFRASAAAQDVGDLFEYKLTAPITIRKNQSALVPILQSSIDAEPVTLWNSGAGHALRAVWITNSSGLTLDSGSFNVIDSGSFAGEGLVDAVKPGEKRLISYALDLGLRVESKNHSDHENTTRVRLAKGILTETLEARERQVYTVRNEDSSARTVIIEHPARAGWKLAACGLLDAKGAMLNEIKPEETTANLYRFRVTVQPHQSALLAVNESQPQSRTYRLASLGSDDIRLLVQQKSLDPQLEQALRSLLVQKNEVAALDQQIKQQEEQVSSIGRDQQRLRENLKALKGSPEEKQLVLRYTRELNEQEDRVEALRRNVTSLEQQRMEAQRKLDRSLETLAFESAPAGVSGAE